MPYTVEYHMNNKAYCYETFNSENSLAEVIEEILYKMNRYGTDYNAIVIFDNYGDIPDHYYEVVNNNGYYELVEELKGGLCVHSTKHS